MSRCFFFALRYGDSQEQICEAGIAAEASQVITQQGEDDEKVVVGLSGIRYTMGTG